MKLILSLFLWSIHAGLIKQYLRKPIEPSVSNENEIADYTFLFQIETDLFAGDTLLIKFPSQYTTFPLVDFKYSINIQIWNGLIWESLKGSYSCLFRYEIHGFSINVADMKAGYYQATIYGITNPTEGGTGSFILESRRNQAYLVDINLLDYNYAFDQVGITAAPTDFTALVITNTATFVNEVGEFKFSFTPSKLIPGGGYVIIDLKKAIIKVEEEQFSSTLDGSISYEDSKIKILTNSDQNIQSYNIVLQKVRNPRYSGIPGTIKLQTWMNDTNIIINQRIDVNLPAIQAGQLAIPTLSAHVTLEQTEALSINDVVVYQAIFTTKNSISNNGVISFDWLAGGLGACFIRSGLYDKSQDKQVICNIVGNQYQIRNFKSVQANTIIKIIFTITNPATSGTISQNLIISTFEDDAMTKKIDHYSGPIGLNILNYPQLTEFDISFPTASHQQAGQTATYLINFYHTSAIDKIVIKFNPLFQDGGITCTVTTNAGNPDDGTCTFSNGVLTITLGTEGPNLSTSASNTLQIDSLIHPNKPGTYPIGVNFENGGVIVSRQTIYQEILPYVLSGIQVMRLSRDKDKKTLFLIEFPAPIDLPSSEFKADFNAERTELQLEFETDNDQFGLSLGTGLKSGSKIPCYGTDYLQGVNQNEISCYIQVPNAQPDPVIIRVSNYDKILQGKNMKLHLPNIQNPYCQQQVTDDIPCPNNAHIALKILHLQSRMKYVWYQSDATDPQTTLDPVLPQEVVKNPKNDDMPDQSSSNSPPIFSPNIINQVSSTSIRYQPGLNKYLTFGNNNHMIFIFPPLPTTTVKTYILPRTTQLQCSIGLDYPQTCYSYPEVGWVVILDIDRDIPDAGSLETIFFLQGFQNPYYAANINDYLQIYTISNEQEVEHTIFQNMLPYSTGSLTNVRVVGKRYEANFIDVEYTWLFSFDNDIPEEGMIDLIFPKNFYNVQDSIPTPTFEILLGLESVKGQFTQSDASQSVNVYTISNFKRYSKNTLISLRVRGVKNPPVEGLTNYFEIKSKTKEAYEIDYKRDINSLYILRPLASGQVTFNSFTMSPDNGSPEGDIFPANYVLSFYPTRDIPKYGYIEITFPLTEFIDSSAFLNDPLRCYLSGAITTFYSCEVVGTSTVVKVTLDTPMKVEPGMPPIIVEIPNVKNFGADLNSGVVVVRTIYDGVVLDESGTTEENRKAQTGAVPAYFAPGTYSLTYSPSNEGQRALYTLTIRPTLKFQTTVQIKVEFPLQYPVGLGNNIACSIPKLQKADNDPVLCDVVSRTITIYNMKAYEATEPFDIILSGIRNTNAGTITNGIKLFIMSNATHASEYCPSLGPMTFIPAPPILMMPYLMAGSSDTRTYTDYQIALLSTAAATFTQLQIDFQIGYSIEDLWEYKKIKNHLESANEIDIQPVRNTINRVGTFNVAIDKYWNMDLLQIPNPLDPGILPGYPIISLYDETDGIIKMKTYNNLISYLTPDFQHAGHLIIIGDDDPNFYIEAGTYTNEIVLSLSEISEEKDVELTALYDDTFKDLIKFTPMKIIASESDSKFRIAISKEIPVLRVIVKFSHQVDGYIQVRPIYLWVQRNENIQVNMSQIVEIQAGGRSKVQNIILQNGPFEPLIFNFYILNDIPSFSDVYPKQIILEDGSQYKEFWVSVSKDTQGVFGQVLVSIEGSDKEIFQLEDRLNNFTVVNTETIIPFVVEYSLHDITENQAILSLTMNEDCTIYYWIGPPFARLVTYQQIRDKNLPYDYFNHSFIMGEHVEYNEKFEYSIQISQLQKGTKYLLRAYIEDFAGNLADRNITIEFKTEGYEERINENLEISGNITLANRTRTSLVFNVSLGQGTIHAIAIKDPRVLWLNPFPGPSGNIRYLQESEEEEQQNSVELDEDDDEMDVLLFNDFVIFQSYYDCQTSEWNLLSIVCDPVLEIRVDERRKDIYQYGELMSPSSEQVARGEDHEGIKVQHYSNSTSSEIVFKNLWKNNDYHIFIALEQNGKLSSNVLYAKGTTRKYWPIYGYLIQIIWLIIMCI